MVIYRLGIPDSAYDHYEVSTSGRIRRIGSERMLKGTTSAKGYKNIELQPKKGAFLPPTVAQIGTLVAYAFLGAPPSREHLVARRDVDPSNDQVTNLEYATRSQIWNRQRKQLEERKKRLYERLASKRKSAGPGVARS